MSAFRQSAGSLPGPHAWITQPSHAITRPGLRQGLQLRDHRRVRLTAYAGDCEAGEGISKHMFIFGLGYTALAVGNQLQKLGW